jgi:SAM-dependent methyltransferase
MGDSASGRNPAHHLDMREPSPWVVRFARLVPAGGTVLDLACGGGRHARHLISLGLRVVALDRAVEAVDDLEGSAEIIAADLEDGSPWPLAGRQFDGIIVVNYLHRPLFPVLFDALSPRGVLIYETFALGNERYSRPRNADHLLKGGELLSLVGDTLQVVAYEHGILEKGECPGIVQRICAVNDRDLSEREDGEADPHAVYAPARAQPVNEDDS